MPILRYHDFEILTDDVKRDEHKRICSFSVRVIKFPSGEGIKKETVTVPKDISLAVQKRKLENRELDANLEEQIKFGERLAGLLLPDYARRLFEESYANLADREGLRVRLRLEEDLVAFPWEYMYLRSHALGENILSGFLALDTRISIVRHEVLDIPAEEFRSADKRRIVVAMATPQPYDKYPQLVDLPSEQQLIKDALNHVMGVNATYLPQYRGRYEKDIPGATIEDLKGALAQATDIFHFSGHGDFEEELGPGDSIKASAPAFIVLADENNQAVPLPADKFLELLRGKGVRLVILGACETGERDVFNAWNSVAASLLRGEIPVVIAMQFSIYSDLATAFMDALYESLVAGLTIDEAVAWGRVAIHAKALDSSSDGGNRSPDVRDWGVPVLYLRTPGGRVFNPVTDKQAVEAALKKLSCLALFQLGMQEHRRSQVIERKLPPPKNHTQLKSFVSLSKMAFVGCVIVGMVLGALALELWPVLSPDPSYTLTVFVREVNSSVPLVGVKVFLDDEQKGVTSYTGGFDIEAVPMGGHVVWATLDGYYESIKVLTVVENTEIVLYLTPESVNIDGITGMHLSGELRLGFLGSMTGTLASFGANELAAAQFAVLQVNEYLAEVDANWTIAILVEDTQTDPTVCLEKVESFAARGINLLIGPTSSVELRNIKSYLNANSILAISQSSTSLDLAIADDYVFRFCPNDLGQSPAIARLIRDIGNYVVIPVVRNDIWGTRLRDSVRNRFTDLGGTFLEGIAFTPGATEFTTEVADLNTKLEAAISTYGAANVAVLFIAFEEAGPFFTEASNYPLLQTVTWYGSDGTALADAIIDDPTVADFAVSTRYPNTIFAPTRSAKWEEVRKNNLAVVGREPDPYSYVVYDIVWAYALSLMAVDTYDAKAVKAVLPSVTEKMFGASGWIVLDTKGDRASSDYDIWQVVETTPGVYGWEHTGVWNFASDSITWD